MYLSNETNQRIRYLLREMPTYKEFKDITEEDINLIKQQIESFKKHHIYTTGTIGYELYVYTKAIDFVAYPSVRNTKTFNQKILFLIYCCDPELKLLKTYLSTGFLTNKDIEKYDDEVDRTILLRLRKKQENFFYAKLDKEIGFTDTMLFKFEKDLFDNFLAKNELVKGVKASYLSDLLDYKKDFSFDSISLERLSELALISENYIDTLEKEESLRTRACTAAYNILFRPHLFGLNSYEEQIAFFILCIDKNLDALQIFNNEATIHRIKEESLLNVGIYSKDLIEYEKKYHQKFVPDKIVSDWQLMKKKDS